MNLLSEFPNITVYDKPALVNFDDKRVLFNGWGYNPLEQEDADVLFTHIEINTFTVNDEDSVRRLRALGIDIVIGNFPDMVKRVLAE